MKYLFQAMKYAKEKKNDRMRNKQFFFFVKGKRMRLLCGANETSYL